MNATGVMACESCLEPIAAPEPGDPWLCERCAKLPAWRRPVSPEAINALTHRNTTVDGRGAETAMHMPCPACGASDWKIVKPVQMAVEGDEQFSAASKCKACKRIFALVVNRRPGATDVHLQRGDRRPPPDWMLHARMIPELMPGTDHPLNCYGCGKEPAVDGDIVLRRFFPKGEILHSTGSPLFEDLLKLGDDRAKIGLCQKCIAKGVTP